MKIYALNVLGEHEGCKDVAIALKPLVNWIKMLNLRACKFGREHELSVFNKWPIASARQFDPLIFFFISLWKSWI